MNNVTLLLPVFSSNESDFQENEKISNQIWPRSRLPLFAEKMLSDEEENLRGRPKNPVSKANIVDKVSNIEERTPQINFENASNQLNLNISRQELSGALLRGDVVEVESGGKGNCFCQRNKFLKK